MIYIFHGPDDFSRKEKIAELRAEFGDSSLADLNVTVLEGHHINLGEIRHYADAMPFMTDKRLVIINGYLRQFKGKSQDARQLVDYLGQVPPTTELIFAEMDFLEKRHPVIKAAPSVNARIVRFAGPAQQDLRQWIIDRAKDYNATVEPAAAEMLGRIVGADLRILNSEIEKLTLYVGNKRVINRADVDLLVPYIEDAESFGLANAIGQRNSRKAYDQLHKLLDEDKHPMAILAGIATQIRGLLEVKDMAERRMSPQAIAAKKNWKSDYAVKMRLREASNFSVERLEEILEILLEIDLAIKTGRVDSFLALDTLIARLCTAQ